METIMGNTVLKMPSEAETREKDVRSLLAVIRELTAVMVEENEQLARRIPAGLTAMIERKIRLSDEYERLWRDLLAAGPAELAEAPELLQNLIESATALRKLTEENMKRLESAADASRRRIEAVMNAIRQDQDDKRVAYGPTGIAPANGRMPPKLSLTRA